MNAVKYFFVGGTAALVDWSIFTVFAYLLAMNYLIVSACGFIVATLVNYFLCIRFIFQSGIRFSKNTEIINIFIVSGIGLALHQLILFGLIDLLTLNMLFSKVSATGLVFIWNFALRNYFVFVAKKSVAKKPIAKK